MVEQSLEERCCVAGDDPHDQLDASVLQCGGYPFGYRHFSGEKWCHYLRMTSSRVNRRLHENVYPSFAFERSKTMATGFTGEPVAPTIRNGDTAKRNS